MSVRPPLYCTYLSTITLTNIADYRQALPDGNQHRWVMPTLHGVGTRSATGAYKDVGNRAKQEHLPSGLVQAY